MRAPHRSIFSRRHFVVPGISLVLASCTATNPASRMDESGVTYPGSWAATHQGRAGMDRDWIGNIGGRELSGLVSEAIAANPDLKGAAARVDRAAAESRIAGAGRLPSLGLGAQAQRQQQRFVGFPFEFPGGGSGVAGSLTDSFGVSVNTAWELDLWGKTKAGQEASLASLAASAGDFQAARISLAGQVSKAWLALGEANFQVRLAEEALEARSQLAASVRERYERAIDLDGGSAAQVRLTESEVASGEADLALRKQERERAIRQLEILLGRYPAGRLLAAADLPAMPPPPPPVGLPSELLLRRPDVLAAERRFAARGRRTREARLARFPSIKLTGSVGTATTELRDVLNSDFGIWSLGGSLSQPIFEGGRLIAEQERAAADEREAAAALQKSVLDAFGEVEQALVAETFLRERERAGAEAARLAEDAAQRAGEEFSAGTGDVLTLINARSRQINTASALAAVRRLRLENQIDLHLALGGDFS